MEGSSRTRSILGIGLVLIGSLLLLRALSAPSVLGPLVGRNVEHVVRIEEQQAQIEAQADARQAQIEAQQAQIEAQADARQAQIEAQQAQAEAQAEARQAQIEAQQAQIEAQADARQAQIEARQALDELRRDTGTLPELPPMPAMPALPPLPKLPPMPPVPPVGHMSGWLKPTVVLLALLVLLLWRRGRNERAPTQA
jgi:hypothetical protein